MSDIFRDNEIFLCGCDPDKPPRFRLNDSEFFNPELKVVFTNIDEKEFEEFMEHYRNDPLNNLWLDLALAEEKYEAERRRLWIRSCIKGALKEQGKTPTDELLDAATEFCLKNCMLPSFNPTRNWWFIEMLCCFCDGKPYERNGQKIEQNIKNNDRT